MVKYSVSNFNSNDYIVHNVPDSVYLFHRSLPNYQPSSLYLLRSFAKKLGINEVMVKDESERFGLNAFKILGASWAIASALAEYHKISLKEINYLKLKELTSTKPKLTFVTTTDGNHGRGVAHAAKWFKQKAVVYMPKGATKQRVSAIKDEGAQVTVLDMNYDDAVKYANKVAKENNWILLQDTAFNNYTKIPQLIMDGYETIISEIFQQSSLKPTHIILQAGVGSFAAAIINGFHRKYKYTPTILIVEPHNAACYYHSNLSQKPYTVKGDLSTIMAGLSCGKPSTIAYNIITETTKAYFSVDDKITIKGIRRLANPLKDDSQIISGESGAVGIGLLEELCINEEYLNLRNELALNENAVVLCISTEGATDLASYNKIVGN